jgi:hypothetical protein
MRSGNLAILKCCLELLATAAQVLVEQFLNAEVPTTAIVRPAHKTQLKVTVATFGVSGHASQVRLAWASHFATTSATFSPGSIRRHVVPYYSYSA